MMRITRAVLHDVELPLRHTFKTSSHSKNSLRHLIVEVHDAEGRTGWGEIASPAGPYYVSETTDVAWYSATQYLLPALIGAEWDHPSEVSELFANVRGHFFAKAGVEMAAWTLYAQAQDQSLSTVLGGTRSSITAGVSLGIEPSIEALLAEVETHVEAGYPRIKLKIAPGWDIEPVSEVRRAYPQTDIHVDANGAYPGTPESFAVFQALDQYGLTMIEQPFAPRNLLDSAQLQKLLTTPVCLDESVETLDDLRTAITLKAGGILNIKVSRMGGLHNAQQAHDLALDAEWPMWCGGMHEFGIGRLANVAMASLSGFTLPNDVSASEKYYAKDIIDPPVTAENGIVTVPQQSGLGASVKTKRIRSHSTNSEEFQS